MSETGLRDVDVFREEDVLRAVGDLRQRTWRPRCPFCEKEFAQEE